MAEGYLWWQPRGSPAAFDGWVQLVREEFETEDMSIDGEKSRLRAIGRGKRRRLEALGVDVELLRLAFDCGIVYNPPEEGEECVWAIDYFKGRMLEFVDSDEGLAERLLQHQRAVHGADAVARPTSPLAPSSTVASTSSLSSSSSSSSPPTLPPPSPAATPLHDEASAAAAAVLPTDGAREAGTPASAGASTDTSGAAGASSTCAASTLADVAAHVAALEGAGQWVQAAEEMAAAMERCKAEHDGLIRDDAASRLQQRARRRSDDRGRRRTEAATRVQAYARGGVSRRAYSYMRTPVVSLGVLFPEVTGDGLVFKLSVGPPPASPGLPPPGLPPPASPPPASPGVESNADAASEWGEGVYEWHEPAEAQPGRKGGRPAALTAAGLPALKHLAEGGGGGGGGGDSSGEEGRAEGGARAGLGVATEAEAAEGGGAAPPPTQERPGHGAGAAVQQSPPTQAHAQAGRPEGGAVAAAGQANGRPLTPATGMVGSGREAPSPPPGGYPPPPSALDRAALRASPFTSSFGRDDASCASLSCRTSVSSGLSSPLVSSPSSSDHGAHIDTGDASRDGASRLHAPQPSLHSFEPFRSSPLALGTVAIEKRARERDGPSAAPAAAAGATAAASPSRRSSAGGGSSGAPPAPSAASSSLGSPPSTATSPKASSPKASSPKAGAPPARRGWLRVASSIASSLKPTPRTLYALTLYHRGAAWTVRLPYRALLGLETALRAADGCPPGLPPLPSASSSSVLPPSSARTFLKHQARLQALRSWLPPVLAAVSDGSLPFHPQLASSLQLHVPLIVHLQSAARARIGARGLAASRAACVHAQACARGMLGRERAARRRAAARRLQGWWEARHRCLFHSLSHCMRSYATGAPSSSPGTVATLREHLAALGVPCLLGRSLAWKAQPAPDSRRDPPTRRLLVLASDRRQVSADGGATPPSSLKILWLAPLPSPPHAPLGAHAASSLDAPLRLCNWRELLEPGVEVRMGHEPNAAPAAARAEGRGEARREARGVGEASPADVTCMEVLSRAGVEHGMRGVDEPKAWRFVLDAKLFRTGGAVTPARCLGISQRSLGDARREMISSLSAAQELSRTACEQDGLAFGRTAHPAAPAAGV